MDSKTIRKKFLDFFESRGHAIVPSSSLIPENDPSVLFTTAGMQQFKPYYSGVKKAKSDFGTSNTTSVQKSIRTSDIEEVGDDTHLSFFEMLGNFSFGGYFKKEAIELAHEFITKELELEIDYVSVYEGDSDIPGDTESENIWNAIDSSLIVKKFGKEDNFWGPTGNEGPCGPTTEIYVNGVEIWNIVFNEYYCNANGSKSPLKQKGVDTGMGLERLLTMLQKKENVFETDVFETLMKDIEEKVSSESKVGNNRIIRIIADHIKTSIFLLSDGVLPSNSERGYILRRLLRRAVRYMESLGVLDSLSVFFDSVQAIYGDIYPISDEMRSTIISEIKKEEDKFKKTLAQGLKQFDKGERDPFVLFTTYGFPLEMTQELALEKGEKINEEDFFEKMRAHQERSRSSAAGKFKGGLAGHSEMEIKYHTATHMLHQALREVLGNHVVQKGSNITTERLRFDFSHHEKMTDDEKKKVEELINEKIKESLPVTCTSVVLDEAKDMGALGVFEDKYEDKVDVYTIGDQDAVFSIEICGGPHVTSTSELGTFRIKKEESASAGVRRIKAVLE